MTSQEGDNRAGDLQPVTPVKEVSFHQISPFPGSLIRDDKRRDAGLKLQAANYEVNVLRTFGFANNFERARRRVPLPSQTKGPNIDGTSRYEIPSSVPLRYSCSCGIKEP